MTRSCNMAASLPAPPATLKSVQHHLKTAQEHDTRDPVIAYYCRMYALQKGMQLDKSSPDAKKFLYALMDLLEQSKTAHASNEAISSDTVGHAHVEHYALKMFAFADSEDRAARHNKNVVKSFYTAGMLFDVLSVFGDISEDIDKYMKYAKYKAAYIHKCLKAGEAPIPGPTDEEGHDIGFGELSISQPGVSNPDASAQSSAYGSVGGAGGGAAAQPQPSYQSEPTAAYGGESQYSSARATGGGTGFAVDWTTAMKYTKYANSSLTYEDREAAIEYLQKALNILTTGHE